MDITGYSGGLWIFVCLFVYDSLKATVNQNELPLECPFRDTSYKTSKMKRLCEVELCLFQWLLLCLTLLKLKL